MSEETYLKAKEIMDEVEHLRELKKFESAPDCYTLIFSSSREAPEVIVGSTDIGQIGMCKLINTYTQIIDDLISKNLQKLEELG